MPVPSWPITLPLRPKAQTFSGGPRRMVASFEPEQGVEITRRRVTAAIHVMGFSTPTLDAAQAAVLRTFLEDTCAGGATAFSWIDPRDGFAWLWKPVPGEGPYKEMDLGGGYTQFDLMLVRQPGRPWWSPYVYPATAIAPLMVLDFQNSIGGRPPTRETIAALQAAAPVLGVVDLRRVSNTGVVTTVNDVTINGAWWSSLVPASWRQIIAYPSSTI